MKIVGFVFYSSPALSTGDKVQKAALPFLFLPEENMQEITVGRIFQLTSLGRNRNRWSVPHSWKIQHVFQNKYPAKLSIN